MIHELKTPPRDFEAVRFGRKTHEARLADRPFAVSDDLVLLEWIPAGEFTGRALMTRVTHLTLGEYGLPKDLAIMSIPHAMVVAWDETEEAWRAATWDVPFPAKKAATLRHLAARPT